VSWDGAAGIVTRLWAERSRVRVPVQAKDLSLLQDIQTDPGVHPALSLMSTMFVSWNKVAKA